MFPSNIQGLPTWYEIRVNKDGYTARRRDFDLMVALNPATYAKDVAEVRAGRLAALRLDVAARRRSSSATTSRSSAFRSREMCNGAFEGERERILMRNIAYAGALAALLDIDIDDHRASCSRRSSRKKPALLDSNQKALALGFDYAKKHFTCPLPIPVSSAMDKTKDTILIDGNTAAALGCAVRRRDGRRVVSDHAGDVADGGVQRLLQAVPRRSRDGTQPLRHPPGRGRARRRSAW